MGNVNLIENYMIDNVENLNFKRALVESPIALKAYDMKNEFLTDDQKVRVECWYQLPIGIFSFMFFSLFIFFKDLTILEILITASLFSLVIAILNWKFFWKPFYYLGFVFGGNFSSLTSILFAIYFGFESNWVMLGLAIADAIGFLGVITPSVWLYTFFALKGYPDNIHPKYVFAMKYFKILED